MQNLLSYLQQYEEKEVDDWPSTPNLQEIQEDESMNYLDFDQEGGFEQ